MSFTSTKKFGPISTGHRQWKDTGHCAWLHGYGRYVQLTFAGEPDERSWVVDFGDLRDVKALIEETWDHKFLIASNDPELERIRALEAYNIIRVSVMDVERGHNPSIEGSAKWVYDSVASTIANKTNGRAWLAKVEIWEHQNNTATYTPSSVEILCAKAVGGFASPEEAMRVADCYETISRNLLAPIGQVK